MMSNKKVLNPADYQDKRKVQTCHIKRPPEGIIVRVDRGTAYGNPFPITKEHTREMVIGRYFTTVLDEFKDSAIRKLYRTLITADYMACWCSPKDCHGDVLSALVQAHHDWQHESNTGWQPIHILPSLHKTGDNWFCFIGAIWNESPDLWTVVYQTLMDFQSSIEGGDTGTEDEAEQQHAIQYPEIAKIQKPRDEHIADFVHWLEYNGYTICTWQDKTSRKNPETGSREFNPAGYVPARKTARDFVQAYFEIDPVKHEEELRSMLSELRKQNTHETDS